MSHRRNCYGTAKKEELERASKKKANQGTPKRRGRPRKNSLPAKVDPEIEENSVPREATQDNSSSDSESEMIEENPVAEEDGSDDQEPVLVSIEVKAWYVVQFEKKYKFIGQLMEVQDEGALDTSD